MTQSKGLFRPGSGFWGSLGLISNVVFAVLTVVSIPVDMLTNRRVGERYLSPLLFIPALLALWPVVFVGQLLFAPVQWWVQGHILSGWRRPGVGGSAFALMGMFVCAVVAAYVAHRIATWVREQHKNYVYSFHWGIPVYLIPLWGKANAAAVEEPEVEAEAADTLLGQVRAQYVAGWRQMLLDIRARRVPEGRVPWLAMTVLHPLAVSLVGVVLAVALFYPLGGYLFLVGIAMLTRGRIISALFREEVLDHRDSHIEKTVWSEVVSGRKSRAMAKGYALPVATAHITQEVRASVASRLAAMDSRFAELLRPASELEAKPASNGATHLLNSN